MKVRLVELVLVAQYEVAHHHAEQAKHEDHRRYVRVVLADAMDDGNGGDRYRHDQENDIGRDAAYKAEARIGQQAQRNARQKTVHCTDGARYRPDSI